MLCTLFRKDGSRFARLHSDSRDRVLGVAFYRRSGALRSAVDTRYAVPPEEIGASVKCDSSSQASIGPAHWRVSTLVDRRDGEGHRPRRGRRGGPEGAERMDEQHQLVRHQGRGEPTRAVRGQDVAGAPGQARRQERHRLGQPGDTTRTATGRSPVPGPGTTSRETRSSPTSASTPRSSGRRRVPRTRTTSSPSPPTRSATSFQFDHVTNQSKRDYTELMWPYVEIGDTTGRKLGRGDGLQDNNHY